MDVLIALFFPSSRREQGFTLVELLIVVAIIGVLSTVGIPTFKKMVQKSKQAEAKTRLGGLYKAEAAFQGEYGVYTNHFRKLGIDVGGALPSSTVTDGLYAFGFFDDDTDDCSDGATSLMAPSLDPWYSNLIAKDPGFTIVGGGGVRSGAVPAIRSEGYCRKAEVAPDGSVYEASANGVIIPGVDPEIKDPEFVDQWTINAARQLSHVHDGTK